MPNTNFQTFHQMGNVINDVVRQATGRDNVQNIDMDFVTVAQRKRLVEEIITGNPVTFVTNIAEPLDYLIAQINPVQSGSGDPSPENVRPISGWDSVQITRTGKNLCKSLAETTSFRNVTFTLNKDGTVKANRTDSYNGNSYVAMQEIILPAGTYKCSGSVGGSSSTYWLDFVFDNTAHVQYDSEIEITLEKETTIVPWLNVHKNYSASNVVFYPMIRLSTENDATYEKYAGQVYPISLSTTAYGGTLTVNKDGTGVLTVTHGYSLVSNLTWEKTAGTYSSFSTNSLQNEIKKTNSEKVIISDIYRSYSNNTSPATGNNVYSNNAGQVKIKDAEYHDSTVETFTQVRGNAQLVYELATPVEIDLTELEVIETLNGVNNIWSDTGNVTVLYKNYEEVI